MVSEWFSQGNFKLLARENARETQLSKAITETVNSAWSQLKAKSFELICQIRNPPESRETG